MAVWTSIIETNPLSEFNRYLYIASPNKIEQVFVFKFPYESGARVEVKNPYRDPSYIIHPLIFDGDTFKEVPINGISFFETECYEQCHQIITKLLIFDKYRDSFVGVENGNTL